MHYLPIMEGNVYWCSNGQYYGDVDLWERLEAGEWKPCAWDEDSGTEWVYTSTDDMLSLTPVSPSELPPGQTVTETSGGLRVETAKKQPSKPKTHR